MGIQIIIPLRIDNSRQSVICAILRYLALLSISNPHNNIVYIK